MVQFINLVCDEKTVRKQEQNLKDRPLIWQPVLRMMKTTPDVAIEVTKQYIINHIV